MKTIKKVSIESKYVNEIPQILDEGILYICQEYKIAVHNCLCGCGNKTVTSLRPNEWNLTHNKGKISMSPSIGNYNFPCKSHYIITNGIANFV